MWERLRLEELEQTHAKAQTHTQYTQLRWNERGVIKMKSTGGLGKHIRHQTVALCGNWLQKTEYHDFPGKTVTLSVTLTTVCLMKRKAGLDVIDTNHSRASQSWGSIQGNSKCWERLCIEKLKSKLCTRTNQRLSLSLCGLNNLK